MTAYTFIRSLVNYARQSRTENREYMMLNDFNYEAHAEPLVSIIMPAYNAEKHIEEALLSLQQQTITSWEVLITDDCSTDSTRDIIEAMAQNDSRIQLFISKENNGAAIARNNSLAHARGRFIAYLDADDIWYPEKLEQQICFMKENNIYFSCASYAVVDKDGKPLGKTVKMLNKCDYMGFLTHNLLQTVGIMADTKVVDRNLLVMPDLKRCEDAATWLQVLKAGYPCFGLPEVLCCYRRVTGSLSSDKLEGASHIWNLYQNIEHLSIPFSLYCFVRYVLLAIWKRYYPSVNARKSQ